MIPYLLAALGGYLIGQSRKREQLSDGGLMKDFEKNFTTAYILQQQMKEKEAQRAPTSSEETYYTIPYGNKYHPARWYEGMQFASMELHDAVRDPSGAIKDSEAQEVEDKITAYFEEEIIKKKTGKEIHDMWKSGQGLTVPKRKKKWYELAKGGNIDDVNTEVLGIKKNMLGTASITLKMASMRKPQEFSVYPIKEEDAGKPITIQSDTRIGLLQLSTGRGLMSQSHANGAYFVHLQMDKKVPFKISKEDAEKIRKFIIGTAGASVGESVVKSDNLGAAKMEDGGAIQEGDLVRLKEDKNVSQVVDDANKDWSEWEKVDNYTIIGKDKKGRNIYKMG